MLLNELTRGELNQIAPEAVVVLPTGATEQHGPHLPVGTDTFAVEAVARGAVAALADRMPVLMAPVLPYGSSHHHLSFGGTMSLTLRRTTRSSAIWSSRSSRAGSAR